MLATVEMCHRVGMLTRISNLDSDDTALERLAVQSQSLLQALEVLELGVGETLGTLLLAVLDDADVNNVASLKELGDGLDGGIVGQVAQVSGKRGLVGERLGEVLADGGVAAVVSYNIISMWVE